MRIAVCVKQIPDPTTVKFNIVTGQLDNARYIIDPVDEAALSEAIKQRDKNGGKVVAISLGPPDTEEVLRTCLKMGADEAIHLRDQAFSDLDISSTAIVIARLLSKGKYDIVLCGKESTDEGNGFLGAGIAEELGLPLVTSTTRIDIFTDTNSALVRRRVKGGDREVVETPLPAVFTVDSILSSPVYPRLRTILAGLKKSITRLDAGTPGIDLQSIQPAMASLGISQPKPRLKKTAAMDSSLSAQERMKLLMSGGVQQKKSSTVEKSPKEAAAEIIHFLIDNGILTKEQ